MKVVLQGIMPIHSNADHAITLVNNVLKINVQHAKMDIILKMENVYQYVLQFTNIMTILI